LGSNACCFGALALFLKSNACRFGVLDSNACRFGKSKRQVWTTGVLRLNTHTLDPKFFEKNFLYEDIFFIFSCFAVVALATTRIVFNITTKIESNLQGLYIITD
jgi:hypothetical protein